MRCQSTVSVTKKIQPKFYVVEKKKRYRSIKSSVKGTHYSEIRNEKYKLNIKEKNSYILMTNNDVFKIFSFVVDDSGEIFVVGKRFAKKKAFQNLFPPAHLIFLKLKNFRIRFLHFMCLK